MFRMFFFAKPKAYQRCQIVKYVELLAFSHSLRSNSSAHPQNHDGQQFVGQRLLSPFLNLQINLDRARFNQQKPHYQGSKLVDIFSVVNRKRPIEACKIPQKHMSCRDNLVSCVDRPLNETVGQLNQFIQTTHAELKFCFMFLLGESDRFHALVWKGSFTSLMSNLKNHNAGRDFCWGLPFLCPCRGRAASFS